MLKKAIAISLLLLLLFTTGGYYFIFWGLKQDAISKLNKKLDEDKYEEGETLLVKVPLTLPYPIANIGYQRISGQYEHNGESFSLVKQKHEADTLYIICIKNERVGHYNKAVQNLVKQTSEQQNSFFFLSKFSADFISSNTSQWIRHQGWCMSIIYSDVIEYKTNVWLRIPSPPPELLSFT